MVVMRGAASSMGANHAGCVLGWLLLSAWLHLSGGQQGAVQVRILYPAPQDVVSGTSAIEMRCLFRGLQGKGHSVAIDVDEEDGGEFPIEADGEYTFMVPPLRDGLHELAVILMREGMIRSREGVTFQSLSSGQHLPPPAPPPSQAQEPPQQTLAQAEDTVPTLTVTAPAQCEVFAMTRL